MKKVVLLFVALGLLLSPAISNGRTYQGLPLVIKQGLDEVAQLYGRSNPKIFIGLWEKLEQGQGGRRGTILASQLEILLDNEGRVVYRPLDYLGGQPMVGRWVAGEIGGQKLMLFIPRNGSFQFAVMKPSVGLYRQPTTTVKPPAQPVPIPQVAKTATASTQTTVAPTPKPAPLPQKIMRSEDIPSSGQVINVPPTD